ncbi:hypothetical protein PBI_NESBITT_27 [Streptomyces phage Nesbitt]|uniref:Uncharacterized protein n=1 Tax=Streptomyces phage Nesbitt TaxID=2108133 RepID=A0A2P1JT35_9CAUD|nr:hypothetical protein PBI_NESBITT_27 [Streptomyces phage Nesbitt]
MSGREPAAEDSGDAPFRQEVKDSMSSAYQEGARDLEGATPAEDTPKFMAVEVHRSEDIHLAKNWGLETLCGERVDFPVGKREATCTPCREAAGLEASPAT